MGDNNKGLNISALKNGLIEDDFEMFGSSTMEIDSVADLEKAPVIPAKDDKTGKDKPEEDQLPNPAGEIEEIEGEVPLNEEPAPATPTAQTPSTPATPTANSDKTTDLLKVFADNLAEKGLIKFSEEDFTKAEDKEAFIYSKYEESKKAEIEEGIAAYKNSLPKEIEELVKLHESGVPLYRILESDSRIDTLEAIKPADIESDVALQKEILTELYTAQGFSKERVDAKLKRSEDLGTLKDEAAEGFDILLAKEKAEKQKMIAAEQAKRTESENKRNEELKNIEATINASDEIIPGFKLSPEDKKTLINGITKVASVDKNGRQMNALAKARIDDPKMDLKVAYFTLILKGDLSKLENKAATKVTRSLKDVVNSQEPLTGASQGGANTPGKTSAVNRDVIKSSLKYLRKTSPI